MINVRELQAADIASIINYWLNSDPDFLKGMGVKMSKMPSREQWQEMLEGQLLQPYREKQSYCTIWELDGRAVGHCNVNKIIYGEEAYMHLHLWDSDTRQKGLGVAFIRKSLPFFFHNLELKTLYCEPYSLNPAPNKTLEKVGFKLIKSFVTTPGWLNFEQEVNLWELTQPHFRQLPNPQN